MVVQFMEYTYSYLFRMISHEMKQKADQRLEQFDITNEQGHTLGYLYAHQQDGLTQNDIAKALQRTGATVSNLLKNLERKSLFIVTLMLKIREERILD